MIHQDFSQLPLFNNMDAEQIALIEPLFEPCRFPKDSIVFEQGEPAQYLFIVLRGEVLVRYKAYDGPLITVNRVGPGGVFGWSAILGRVTYTSGAVCTENTETCRIHGKTLHRMCNKDPETGFILLERLACMIAELPSSKHEQVMTLLTQSANDNG